MTDTTEFRTSDGTVVRVEVDGVSSSGPYDGDPYEPISRRRTDRTADTADTLRQAVDRVRPAAQDVLDSLRAMPQMPDRVALEFGVKLSAEAGVVLARAASEGHFKILLEWEQQPDARGRDTEPADEAPRPEALHPEALHPEDPRPEDPGAPDAAR
ncbi:CU044_2847 family protein [Streptomyces sp. NPDC059477]|uniref:CU044_2847 family protein n=1 Tax=Streptomyces sp. NPDC059477 TaxID=3346847 RepID=UPI003680EEA5